MDMDMDKVCDNCGNKYDKNFLVITSQGKQFEFDCFECAINELAPRCAHCATPVIGHGVEDRGIIYCCGHCSEFKSMKEERDSRGLSQTEPAQGR